MRKYTVWEEFDCPAEELKAYLAGKGIRFPVPEKEFNYWMGRYYYEVQRLEYWRQAGFIEGKLVFYQMTFKYKGFALLDEAQRKAFRDKLEAFVDALNKKSGPSLHCFLSTYDVWPWVRFNEIIVGDAQ